MTGTMTPCCRSNLSYGDWREEGLDKVWSGQRAKRFRKAIIEGKYPTTDCETCYLNGTATTMARVLGLSLQRHAQVLKSYRDEGIYQISRLRLLFPKTEMDTEAREILESVDGTLDTLAAHSPAPEYSLSIEKLKVLSEVIRSFLEDELEPAHIAPVRQVNAVAVCNARCVQCPFLYTKEIIRGVPMPDGSRKRHMEADELDIAFGHLDGALDFFLNGSEFFLIKRWKTIADHLASHGVQIRVSTNGMLLTRENVEFLVEGGYLAKLNCSIDGSTKPVIESTRRNVKFETLSKNLEDMFEIVSRQNKYIGISMSYCLMKRNYRDLPNFVDFILERMGRNVEKTKPIISIQTLEKRGTRDYFDFLRGEHASVIPHEDLKAVFVETQSRAEQAGIRVIVFYHYTLPDFIAAGCPIPESEEIVIPDGVGLLDA